MPEHTKLMCCNVEIDNGKLLLLKDFKGFIKRKLFIGKCKKCGDDAVLQIMTSIDNGKTYFNLYNGIEAVKTIYREKKRIVAEFPDIKADGLYGWVYGINVQIKNKKGIVVQQRQYAGDFFGNRKKVKSQTIS